MRPAPSFDVLIAGAGVAALAAARYIRAAAPSASIALVSPHPPMSQTSSLSSECFRDHWPTADMRAFMGRSISLLEGFAADTGNAFRMSKQGYLYVSREPAATFLAEAAACHGEAAVRRWGTGTPLPGALYDSTLTGADVFLDAQALRSRFPFVGGSTAVSGMHARNAGWMSAQTMGMSMLEELRQPPPRASNPVGGGRFELLRGRVVGAALTGGASDRISHIHVDNEGVRSFIPCGAFVNASGPQLGATHAALFHDPGGEARAAVAPTAATCLGVTGPGAAHGLPVYSEVHAKVVFRDGLGVIPRDAPMTISNDAITLPWSEEEAAFLEEAYGPHRAARLLSSMPAGCHFRPYGGEGSDAVLMLWEAWHHGVVPPEPPPDSLEAFLDTELYPEVALRGLATIVPDLAAYFNDDVREGLMARRGGARGDGASSGKPYVDGGYYTKVAENTPLIGPAPGRGGHGALANGFICGALSGYGIMAAHAAGELCAAHVVGGTLPAYAPIMTPLRYQDADYMAPGVGGRARLLAAGGGQL